MKTIYVHLDPTKFDFSPDLKDNSYTFSDIPGYAEVSFKQSLKYLNDEVIILTNDKIKKYNNDINEFYLLCKTYLPSHYNDPFWLLTLLRIYVLYLYVKDNNINKFLHMEYDNLIYDKLQCLDKLKDGIYFTYVGPLDGGSAGIVFCNNLNNFDSFIQSIKKLIKNGENKLRNITGNNIISEMNMIHLIYRGTKGIMDYLPTLPEDKYFDELGIVFDGASYGQFISGTNNGHDKGWAGNHHRIGSLINQNKLNVEFNFKTKKPNVTYNGKKSLIGNLHIHKKNLNEFV